MKSHLKHVLVAGILSAAAFAGRADEPRRLNWVYIYGGDWKSENWKEYVAGEGGAVTTNSLKWIDGSVAIISNGRNCALSKDVYCYGLGRGASGFVGGSSNTAKLTFGAGGFLFTASTDFNGWFGRNMAFVLADSQEWRSASGKWGTFKAGYWDTYLSRNGTPSFVASNDVVWTLSNINLNLNACGALTNCDVVVGSGATLTVENGGTLNLNGAAPFGFSSVSVASGSAKLAGTGTVPLTNDFDVSVASGASLSIATPLSTEYVVGGAVCGISSLAGAGALTLRTSVRIKSLADFTGTLTVSAGGVQLPAMADWPQGLTVATETGSAVRLDSMQGYDAARITGDGLIVPVIGDTPYAASELTLNAGQFAVVEGDGLTADTTVTLNGGELRFERTATVASPINVTGSKSVIRTTADGMTATLTGFVTVKGGGHYYTTAEDVSLRLYGPGTNVIAGGLSTRYGGDQLWLCEGTAIVSNRQVTLGTTYSGDVPVYGAYSGIREKGRRLVVCNGGSIVLPRPYIASWLVVSGQNDPVLEVATGGTVQFNTAVRFSQSNGSLLVSGGNFNVHGFATGDFSLAESGCNGRVVLSAGTLSLSRPIAQAGTGEFVFDGGKLSLDGGGDEYASWGRNFRYLANGPVVSVTENGGTLDMSGCRSVVTVVTNQLGRKASFAWQGPGTLTVVGAANRDIAFHVNVSTNVDGSAAASTLGLSFRNVPSVTFAGVTEGAVGLDKLDLQDARLASLAD